MPKKDKCLIVFVLDRSGSMESVKDDAIGGFNRFMDDQRKVPGEAEVYLVQFDHEYQLVFEHMPINDVPPLDETLYVPRGTTALLDAVGRTIDDIGRNLDKMEEATKPEKVMLVVLTDGFENASSKYSNQQVKDKIEHQRSRYNWEVIFLAAGVDAWSQAQGMGISQDMAFTVAKNKAGMTAAYDTASLHTTAYRTGKTTDKINWSNNEGKGEGSNA